MHREVIYSWLYCNTLGLNINFSRSGCNSNSGCPKLKRKKQQQIRKKKAETISCYKQLFHHILFVLIGWFALDPQVHLSLSVLQKHLNCTQLFSKKWRSHYSLSEQFWLELILLTAQFNHTQSVMALVTRENAAV